MREGRYSCVKRRERERREAGVTLFSIEKSLVQSISNSPSFILSLASRVSLARMQRHKGTSALSPSQSLPRLLDRRRRQRQETFFRFKAHARNVIRSLFHFMLHPSECKYSGERAAALFLASTVASAAAAAVQLPFPQTRLTRLPMSLPQRLRWSLDQGSRSPQHG